VDSKCIPTNKIFSLCHGNYAFVLENGIMTLKEQVTESAAEL